MDEGSVDPEMMKEVAGWRINDEPAPTATTVNVGNYYLFMIKAEINGKEIPSVKLKITESPPTYEEFKEKTAHIAWARFNELLRKCSTHPEFDAWCEMLGLQLEIEGD